MVTAGDTGMKVSYRSEWSIWLDQTGNMMGQEQKNEDARVKTDIRWKSVGLAARLAEKRGIRAGYRSSQSVDLEGARAETEYSGWGEITNGASQWQWGIAKCGS